jgi:hypothetical protein
MTARRDPDRLIHDFLMEGQTELPGQVYDAVRDRIEQTRQRAVIGPWRTPIMSRFAAIGLGAVAVVVVLLVGAQLLGTPNNVGSGGEPTPTTERTFTTEPSPSVAWRSLPAECGPTADELEAGTYGAPIGTFSVTATVPTGWSGSGDRDGFELRSRPCLFGGGVNLRASLVSLVYSSACDGATAVETATPAAVIAALAAQTGHQTIGPSDTTIAGHPATRFEFSIPAVAATCGNLGPLWRAPGGSEGPTMYEFDGSRSFVTVYVIDVDGLALAIGVDSGVPDDAADVAELNAIVASLQIEP